MMNVTSLDKDEQWALFDNVGFQVPIKTWGTLIKLIEYIVAHGCRDEDQLATKQQSFKYKAVSDYIIFLNYIP